MQAQHKQIWLIDVGDQVVWADSPHPSDFVDDRDVAGPYRLIDFEPNCGKLMVENQQLKDQVHHMGNELERLVFSFNLTTSMIKVTRERLEEVFKMLESEVQRRSEVTTPFEVYPELAKYIRKDGTAKVPL